MLICFCDVLFFFFFFFLFFSFLFFLFYFFSFGEGRDVQRDASVSVGRDTNQALRMQHILSGSGSALATPPVTCDSETFAVQDLFT